MAVDWGEIEPRQHAGETVLLKFHVVDADGADVNITGVDFGLYLADEADPATTYAATSGFTVTNAAGGRVQVPIPRSSTSAWGGRRFRVELWDRTADAVLGYGLVHFLGSVRP